ncbi:transposase [Candidatus Enterovibrio escicola]|uniref:transposase n=1 Tax=Candidatus Enterovibrio escicola TaxID=1927127 RepID=UPI001237D821|nr:transposase [Candidatus Enterovibrio escacola]
MIKLMPSALIPLRLSLIYRQTTPTDSECLRGWRLHKVVGIIGWFYSFKLHLIINDQISIISVKVTTTNVDDRKTMPDMVNDPSLGITL